MKKKIYFITTILLSAAVLSLSSCLKDPRYVDFSKVGTLVEFPLGGLEHFGADAVTQTPDTDANGTITLQFAVTIASPTVPTTATTVTLAVDNTIVTSYNATESSVVYNTMPTNAFVFTSTSVSIPANQRSGIATVTFYKNLLDPSKSYMLPIKIVSASDGATVSGNFGIHYFHFIGNDFAGAYTQIFRRWNADDSLSGGFSGASFTAPVTIFPVTPTEFIVKSGYDASLVSYDVSFTKNPGANPTYQDFSVQLLPSDLAVLTANGLSQVVAPSFVKAGGLGPPVAGTPYTYAQAIQLFRFVWTSHSSADRYNEDIYYR